MVPIQARLSGRRGVMDQREEDRAALQLSEEPQEEEEEEQQQHPSRQSVLPTGSQDQMGDKDEPAQGQRGNSGDEWDTDLETDGRLR